MQQTHSEHKHGNGRGRKPGKGNGRRYVETCPYCGEKDMVIPILYGFPSHEGFMRAERGEVFLGGYEISPHKFYCKRDDREF